MWLHQTLLGLVLGLSLLGNTGAVDPVCVIGMVNHQANGLKCSITTEADFSEIHSNVTALSLAFDSSHNVDFSPGIIPSLPDLEYLQIDVTYVSSLSASVFNNLPTVTELSVSKQLTDNFDLEMDVFMGLDSLKKLGLSHLNLRDLNAGVFNGLGSLGYLDLSNNGLIDLPDDLFSGLDSLHTLVLYHNYIADLKSLDFNGLTAIVTLDLTDNQIDSVESGSFSGLSHLEKLTLESNGLTTIGTDAFAELSSVHTLILNGNHLTALPKESFKGMNNLLTLDIRDNDLSQVDEAFQGLASTESLVLTGNSFSTLTTKSFSGLSSLKVLDLSDNRLSVIQNNIFSELTNLEELMLKGNNLDAIFADAFKGLDKVKLLDLSYNKLTSIADAFEHLGEDSTVNLVSNPWDCEDVTWLAEWYAKILLAGSSCDANAAEDVFINRAEMSCHTPDTMQDENLASLAMKNGSEICVEEKPQNQIDDKDGSGLGTSEKAALVACLILLAIIIVLLVALCLYLRQKKYAMWTPSKNDGGQQQVTRRDKLLYTAKHKTPSFYWDPESGRLENIWDNKGAGKKGGDTDAVDHAYSNPALVDNSPIATRRGDSEDPEYTRADYMNGVVVVDDGGIKHRDTRPDITYQAAALPGKSDEHPPSISKKGSDNAGFYEDLDPDDIQAAPLPTKSMKLQMRSSSSSGDSDPNQHYPQVVVNDHHSVQAPSKKREVSPDNETDHPYEDVTFENPEYMQHKKTAAFKGSAENVQGPSKEPEDYIAQYRQFSRKGAKDMEAENQQNEDAEQVDDSSEASDYETENHQNKRSEEIAPGLDEDRRTPEGSPVPAVRIPSAPKVLIPESEREEDDNSQRASRLSSRSSSSSSLISDHSGSPIPETPDYEPTDDLHPSPMPAYPARPEQTNRPSHPSDRASCHSISSEDSDTDIGDRDQRSDDAFHTHQDADSGPQQLNV